MKILLLLGLLLAGNAFAQTKLIAHKSHSGTVTDFATAYEENLFDMEDSDFGLSSFEVNRVDSVIFVSDSVAVVVRTTGEQFPHKRDQIRYEKKLRDTLVHHPLLRNRHALDSIKKVWSQNFESTNTAEQIRFIGFDNQPPKNKKGKRSVIALPVTRPDQPGNNGGLLIGLVFASGLTAFLVHFRQRSLHQPSLPL